MKISSVDDLRYYVFEFLSRKDVNEWYGCLYILICIGRGGFCVCCVCVWCVLCVVCGVCCVCVCVCVCVLCVFTWECFENDFDI